MTIRKKIMLSNILMIVIPVIFAVIIISALNQGTGNKYFETIETMYEDKNGSLSAQSIIFAYKEELADERWADYGTSANTVKSTDTPEDLTKSAKMRELDQELTNLGYHFSITVNDTILYDNITDEENAIISEYLKEPLDATDSFTMNSGDISIIKNTYYNNACQIVAIHTSNISTMEGNQTYFQKYILTYVVLLIACVVVIIVLLNVVFTWWISKSILIPLRKLSIGSHKIKEGDLDFNVGYYKTDEFGSVCQDFDEMRGHLKKSVEDRIKYEQYRKELLSSISHDLRTPLTSIKGYVEGLMDGIADTKEKEDRYYKAIHTRTHDLEDLVDSLSVYTHLESGKEEYNLKPMELNSSLKQIVKEFQLDTVKNNVIIKEDYLQENLFVNMDCLKIKRVISNLLSNSIKYRTKEDTVIQIMSGMEEGFAFFRFSDDGPGVFDGELERIFECFYRGDMSRTRPAEGSGLGLSIVKQIVEGHGGRVTAYNNKGLTVTIWLPLGKEEK